jgi:hypothetical protein
MYEPHFGCALPIVNNRRSQGEPTMRRTSAFLAVAVACFAFSASVALPAQASDPAPTSDCGRPALGKGHGCQDLDPIDTGCTNGAYLANTADIHNRFTGAYIGTINNWYSPACGTNWAQLINVPHGLAWAIDAHNPTAKWEKLPESGLSNAATPAWTNMVYGVNTPVFAEANIFSDLSGQSNIGAAVAATS